MVLSEPTEKVATRFVYGLKRSLGFNVSLLGFYIDFSILEKASALVLAYNFSV